MRTGAASRAHGQQLDLYELNRSVKGQPPSVRVPRPVRPLCASCRAKEARYGFRDELLLEASRTLCFECFRLEILRRRKHAEQLARARNATQLDLPMSETLRQVDRRRRRAQIAARHALGI